MKKNPIKLFLAVFCTIMIACPAAAGELNLSVAASLKDVMKELTVLYSGNNPSVKFQSNFGSSGALAKQIMNGAPVDIFFSANTEWIDSLKEKNLLDGESVTVFAYNVLVFTGKPGLKVENIQDVKALERIAIGSPKSVPAGEYAMQAMKNAGIYKELENKLVMAKDVRECLMYAERGEVSGAFVYKTDAEEMAKNVKILFTVPQELYQRVTYPMGLTPGGSKNPEAAAFYKFLKTDKAKAVLYKHGFILE